MLSFVVQHFYQQTPFFLKTKKFKEVVGLVSVQIVLILVRMSSLWFLYRSSLTPLTNQITTLIDFFFVKNFWKKIKTSFSKHLSLYPNTFTLSLLYWKFNIFQQNLNSTKDQLPTYQKLTGANLVDYIRPLPILYFAFHKQTYNTLIIYLLKILVNYYYAQNSSFTLGYSFLFYTDNYYFLSFTNRYYFRLRHY